MKSVVSLFLLAWSQLFADVAVVWHSPGDSVAWGDHAAYPQDGKGLVSWAYANYQLMNKGEQFFLTNLQDKDLARLQDPSTTVIILNNLPTWARYHWRDFLAKIPARKMLICWEPPVVMAEMYKKEILDLFDVVLTWNTSLVDNKKFFQFYYPCLYSCHRQMPSFAQRRLLTQISGDKTSNHPLELYSLRRKAIKYFEQHPRKDFCFYGVLWDPKLFHTYGGAGGDKLALLEKYRFSLCFENMKHVKGYVTEKIFDCFRAQTVPVYFGASDIEKLIPKGCYIRWKDFKSFNKLYAYLEKMPEKTYLKYVHNAQKFMASHRGSRFTEDAFGKALLKAILQTKISKKKHYILKK